MRRPPFADRTLIVGMSPLALKLIEEIEARPDCRYAIAGVTDDGADPREAEIRYPVFGPLARLDKIVEEVRPDRIVVALGERRGRLPVAQLLECRVGRGIIVEDATEVYGRLTGKLAIESLTPSSLIFSTDFRKSRLTPAIARAGSLLAAALGLLLLTPLFGLIALAIKLDSRGPVLFVQRRVGLGGRPFNLVKFRTMRPVDRQTSEWAGDNRDRITRVGKWLRKFRVDELPQLVNILQGAMNLVGPRPHPVSNFELFVQEIPYYSLRAVVRPGLTGWAQVRYGYADSLEEETEKMRYDLHYIRHRSLWLDLRVLLETATIVLRGRGAGATGARRSIARTGALVPKPATPGLASRTAVQLAGKGGGPRGQRGPRFVQESS